MSALGGISSFPLWNKAIGKAGATSVASQKLRDSLGPGKSAPCGPGGGIYPLPKSTIRALRHHDLPRFKTSAICQEVTRRHGPSAVILISSLSYAVNESIRSNVALETDSKTAAGMVFANLDTVFSIFAFPVSPSSSITLLTICEGRPQISAVWTKCRTA